MIDFAAIGVREIVLGVIVLVSLYLGITVLRLFFVGSRDQNESVPTVEPVAAAEEDDALIGPWPVAATPPDPLMQTTPAPAAAQAMPDEEVVETKATRLALMTRLLRRGKVDEERREPDLPAAENAPDTEDEVEVTTAPVIDFARELARSNIGNDVQRLQRETAALRDEVAALKEEIVHLRAAQNISPMYNEAMTMAQRGMEAVSIADRCGISMGEAELVAALAKERPTLVHSKQQVNQDRREERGDSDGLYTERGIRRHG